MRKSIRVSTLLAPAIAALTFACSSGSPSAEPDVAPPVGVTAAPTAADLQPTVDVIARAVFTRDVAAFDGSLSNEVHAQMSAKGYDAATFLDKQRGALQRTLRLAENDHTNLLVTGVETEGDAFRVTLRAQDKDLAKALYFVREDGAYKLNFGAPGFSKAPPEGALFGKDNYTIHNVNIYGNGPTTLECYQGGGQYKPFTVAATKSMKVACENTCGWFSGSTFAGNGVVRKCDWNWWGDDVIINLLDYGGWHCNDPC